MSNVDGYSSSKDGYLGPGGREEVTTRKNAAAQAALLVNREAAQDAAFNWGPGGVAKLADEVRTAFPHTAVDGETRLVVGGRSVQSIPLVERDESPFAPAGAPKFGSELHAIALSKSADIAWGVVTQSDADGKISLGVVRLGVGARNPSYVGRTADTVSKIDDLTLREAEPVPYVSPESHTVDAAGVLRAGFQDGQITVQSLAEEGDLTVIAGGAAGTHTPGVDAMVGMLTANTLMWVMQPGGSYVSAGINPAAQSPVPAA